jgi:hypothetical protein
MQRQFMYVQSSDCVCGIDPCDEPSMVTIFDAIAPRNGERK